MSADGHARPPAHTACERCGSRRHVAQVTWPDGDVLVICRYCARADARFAAVPPSMRPVAWSDQDARHDVERPYRPEDPSP